MSVIARQKACIACAEAKRKCDKRIPACKRCVEQELECDYPQRKRRRMRHARPNGLQSVSVQGSGAEAHGSLQGANAEVSGFSSQRGVQSTSAEGSSSGTAQALAAGDQPDPDPDWSALPQEDLDTDWTVPCLPFPLHRATVPDIVDRPVNTNPNGPSAWFLRDETWTLHQSDQLTACIIATDLQPFMDVVRDELATWARTTRCNFFHSRLYEYGMPSCVQDAFTTLAAYVGAEEPTTKQLVLQIAEERASTLVLAQAEIVGDVGLQSHLARAQALFVYSFIRLFDGSVRLRASAEKQLPLFRQWLSQMWEAAKHFRTEDMASWVHDGAVSWQLTSFDREYCAEHTAWRSWILTESVRRTHLVANFVANTYRCMTEGFAPCDGAAMVTVSRGLWAAESTREWTRLIEQKPPMLVPALQPGRFMNEHAAEEIDELAQTYWGMVVGPDKMQSWIERGV